MVLDQFKPRIAKILHPGVDPDSALARLSTSQLPNYDWLPKFIGAWVTPNRQLACLREYILGIPLNIYCDQKPLEHRLKIFEKLTNQLEDLHNQGIVHGNLSWANLLVRNDQVLFLDCNLEEISKGVSKSPEEDWQMVQSHYQRLCLPTVLWGQDSTQPTPLDF